MAETITANIVDLIKSKQKEGFDQLYKQFGPILFGMSIKSVRDAGIAEDIVQETFVKIWRNIEQYDFSKSSFSTWVLNIGRYTTIDYLRSKKYKQRLQNQNFDNSEYLERQQQVSLDIDLLGVKSIIEQLEPKYRQVIDMIYFTGYTQEETATILNIPLGTIKTRTRFALKALRAILEKK